jgi:hypothetical protein
MLTLTQQDPHSIPPLMQDMTFYFTGFRINGSGQDIYSQLFSSIPADRRSEVLFSTLNYECLFEQGLSAHDVAVDYWADAPPLADPIRLWKLHGSCNFIPDPREVQMRREGVSYEGTTNVRINANLLAIPDLDEVASWVRGDTALYAAMCLFMVDKPIQIGLRAISALQKKWQEEVARTNRVIVIGTRYHPQDRHLWEALTSTDADIYYVGSESSFHEWQPYRQPRPLTFIGSRIEQVIDDVKELLAKSAKPRRR